MKILALNYRDRMHPEAGGAERHLHQILSRLVTRGHKVVLLTTSFKGALPTETVDGIFVVRHGSDLMFQYTVAKYLKRLDKQYDFDVIYEDLNKLPLFTPWLSKKPHLVQMHHLWRSSIFFETNFFVASAVWLFETCIPFIYKKSRFVAVSPSTVRELEHLGISHNKIALIYNGTDCISKNIAVQENAAPYFLWLSRVHKYKGILVALKAFKIFVNKNPSLNTVRLKIAGTGSMQKKLPAIISSLDKECGEKIRDRVDILGYVSSDKKDSLMKNALALLQTSYKEGWGLTVMEAAVMSTPTIGSKVPGLMDSICDNKTGLLFEKGDSIACAACMERLAKDPELVKTLSKNAVQYAKTFDWERSSLETEKLLLEIIENAKNKNRTGGLFETGFYFIA